MDVGGSDYRVLQVSEGQKAVAKYVIFLKKWV